MNTAFTPEEIGKKLRRIRKQKGFSQDEIGQILKIPRSSVVQMEKGNRNISLIEVSILTESPGFSVDTFLSNAYEMPSDIAILAEPEVRSDLIKEMENEKSHLRFKSSYAGIPQIKYLPGRIPLKATKQGEPIDYELVFYRRPPYTVRIYEEDFE